MSKKIILISVLAAIVIVAAIVGFIVYKEESSTKKKVFEQVESNYDDIVKAAQKMETYRQADYFSVVEPEDAKEFNLTRGAVYVWSEGTDYADSKEIRDKDIKRAVKLKWVDGALKTGASINFYQDELMEKQHHGICGFYYSFNGEPQSYPYYDSSHLKEDGKGWSVVEDKDWNKYYTEKIKGNIYYYEGVMSP